MSTIIQQREHVTVNAYYLAYNDNEYSGYAFPCDEHGAVLLDEMISSCIDNYKACKTGPITGVIEDASYSYWQPTIILCHCEEHVELHDPMTNECTCGALYNGSGQALRPMDQWEEDW